MPLNPLFPTPELESILAEARLDALIAPAGAPALAVARRLGLVAVELHTAPGRPAGSFTLAAPAAPVIRAAPAAADDTAFILLTSGTTARPKRVPLTHRRLLASARGHRRALELGTSDRCLDLMPLFHVNGLIMLLTSLEAGAATVCPPRFEAARFFQWLAETRPTWLNGTPTVHLGILWQAGLDRDTAARAVARSPLRFIRSASSALPARVGEELERLFGAPAIESYGQTETATLVAISPLPPRPRKPGAAGVAAGPEIAIVDAEGLRVPTGARGEVVVRGANVMAGYEDEPETTAASFAEGWFRTGDLGHLDTDGFLFITGRLKDVINRGGEKIAPREVDEVLMAHPDVREAVTFGVPHRTLGEDVAAAVVLADGAAVSPGALRQFAAQRVAAFKVPRRIVFLAQIPRGLTGKPDRAALARTVGAEVAG
jgi:oxalate---CoA ligase